MNLKLILVSTLISFILVGCGKEIDISEKQLRNGVIYTVNQDTPYSGKIIGKYKNGQIKLSENIKNGKYNGEQIYYYENGQISKKVVYTDGLPSGNYYEYHKNGEIAYTGKFLQGKKDGAWNRYTENKNLILTENYKDGKLEKVEQFLIDTQKVKDKINNIFN